MLRSRALAAAVVSAVLAASLSGETSAPIVPLPWDQGATGLGLALRRLPTTARVLYVTAHPDDEDNGVLVRLSRGLGVRTALLSLTRGEGGQNAIGPELFDALGVLRTGELMAMHRYDGVEQFFGRAYEFGYSFSVEETFEKWGREESLGDVVRVVRAFRPDVIVTLPLEYPGGGQHHQAAARLAQAAFRSAAEPARFPEQLAGGLRPWQARKIYQGGVGGTNVEQEGTPVRVPAGVLDPLLGLTWLELGSLGRGMHRSQAQARLKADPGPSERTYHLLDSEPPVTGPEADILDGIDATVRGWLRFAPGHETILPRLAPSLEDLEAALAAAPPAFDAEAPTDAIPALDAALGEAVRALSRVRDSRLPDDAKAELEERLRDKEGQIQHALSLAQRVAFEVTVDDGEVARGESFAVTARVWNQGAGSATVESLSLSVPPGWSALRTGSEEERRTLGAGGSLEVGWKVTVGPEARYAQPYWRKDPARDRHDVLVPEHETLPGSPPDVVAELRYAAESVSTRVSRPAVFRYPGPFVGGEKRRVVRVVPALSVRLAPEGVVVVPTAGPRPRKELRVAVTNNRSEARPAVARLEGPPGWSITPREAPLAFRYEGEEVTVRFFVDPPAGLAEGESEVRAVVVQEGREHREGVQLVAYDHVQPRNFLRPAAARVLALDVRTTPATSVGYVKGPGDEVAEAIRQLGVPVNFLEPDDLAFGDLSRYSTIVTGIRAYETRDDLRSLHPRLMAYVEAGGNLVVQYNRAPFNALSPSLRPSRSPETLESPFTPYPASVTSRRITDEDAPLTLLVPGHPLFTTPNRIGPADWRGWVQERGIQFLSARDPRYVELLAGRDPFPKNPDEHRGILVEAKVGRGSWTYVGLVLFRQLPAGTPGAYRLLANLVGRPRGTR